MMTDDESRSLDLLDAFLKMPPDARRSLLASLDGEQLQNLVSKFSAGLSEKIRKLPKKPTTARAKKSIACIEVFEDSDKQRNHQRD